MAVKEFRLEFATPRIVGGIAGTGSRAMLALASPKVSNSDLNVSRFPTAGTGSLRRPSVAQEIGPVVPEHVAVHVKRDGAAIGAALAA